MIGVFKPNIDSSMKADLIKNGLLMEFPNFKIHLDFEDRDRILRV